MMQQRVSHLIFALGLALVLLSGVFTALAASEAGTAVPARPAAAAVITSTVADFFLPGTQPHQMEDPLLAPLNCSSCHRGYTIFLAQAEETETWFTWQGSMMAQSGRDPLFYAALDVANAYAENAGEWCLRCHVPRGWLHGRSSAPDGSDMTDEDLEGVQCSVCHRLVDPLYEDENPERDLTVLAAITTPVTITSNNSAAMTVDPADYRRGPREIADLLHGNDPHAQTTAEPTQYSPYHRDAALCGTCHDISNPLFTWNEADGRYQLNDLDAPGDLAAGFPIERTYSEWLLSDYNSPAGIYAPRLGGNKDYVSTCQDCHMRDVTGVGGVTGGPPDSLRDDLASHDLTGGNTWVPQTLPLHPEFGAVFDEDPGRLAMLQAGIERARYMLQNAASLSTEWMTGTITSTLTVTVTNETGHKLPTGYPEGRRMWIQVEGYDDEGNLVYVSGAYNPATAVLTPTADLRLYEAKQGIDEQLAARLDGIEAGPSFHFALNNMIVSDNRIPPRGYEFAAFNAADAAPVTAGQPDAARYEDGQYWDTAVYQLPPEAEWGVVRLLYQTASREYIEFLRDNNPNPAGNNGDILYDLWRQTERSRPEVMAEMTFGLEHVYLPLATRP